MNLGDYLDPDCVALQVEVKDKWSALDRLASLLAEGGMRSGQEIGAADILAALRRREEAQSTGLGDGVAIPHARLPGFHGMTMALLSLRAPIPFDALDGRPVRLVWAILVAEEEPTLALQAYAKINELMRDEAIRAYFESAADPRLVLNYLCQRKIPVGGVLTARDIMRPPSTHILPDMPLREVVHQMHKNRIEAVAVEDESRHVIGEITCDRLFQYGVPDFFNQLQSVKFISRFDPFAKYFSEESQATARDVMRGDFATVAADATILEVVFALAVERHTKIYVVDEGCRIGTIDRLEVLSRILDF